MWQKCTQFYMSKSLEPIEDILSSGSSLLGALTTFLSDLRRVRDSGLSRPRLTLLCSALDEGLKAIETELQVSGVQAKDSGNSE